MQPHPTLAWVHLYHCKFALLLALCHRLSEDIQFIVGEYDVVIIIEAPNDETVMSLMLKVGSAGNVRTKTLKAFAAEEGFKIIKDLSSQVQLRQ
jgi:GYD domain